MNLFLEPKNLRNTVDVFIPVVVAVYVAGTFCREYLEQLSQFLGEILKTLQGLGKAPVEPPAKTKRALSLVPPAPKAPAVVVPLVSVPAPAAPPVANMAKTKVADLRKMARAKGQSRSWCRVAKKAQLLEFLATEGYQAA